MGITDPHDKGWGSWGAGLAADIATDPLTYTPFGAKHLFTPVGKVLSKTGALQNWSREGLLGGFHATEPGLAAAGHSAEDIAHLARGGMIPGVNETPWRVASTAQNEAVQNALGRGIVPGERLSGLVGVGLPWGPKATFGGGSIGRGIARGLDLAGDKLKYAPGMRTLSSLFSPGVAGATDEASQRAFRGTQYRPGGTSYFHGPWSAQASARGASYDWTKAMEPVLQQFPGREEEVLGAATALGEQSAHAHMDPAIIQALQQSPGATDTLANWYRHGRGGLREQRLAGAPVNESANPDALRYIHREAQGFPPAQAQPRLSNFPTQMGFDKHREVLFTQPGGTARINDWAKRFGGTNAEPQILQELMADQAEVNARRGIPGAVTPATPLSTFHAAEGMPTLADQARELAGHIEGMKPRDPGMPWHTQTPYSMDLAGNMERYAYGAGRKLQAARAMPTALSHLAVPWSPDLAGSHIPIPDVLEHMGFQTHMPNPELGIEQLHGIGPETLKALAPKGASPAEQFLNPRDLPQGISGPPSPPDLKGLTSALGQYGIPRESLDDLTKSYARAQAPEQLKPFLGTYDTLTNAFKSLAFPIWPAAHSKKTVSEFITGLRTSNPIELSRNLGKQISMMREPGAGLASSDAARRAQYATGTAGTGWNQFSELAGGGSPGANAVASSRLTPQVPLTGRAGPTGSLLGDIAALPVQGLAGTAANVGKSGAELARSPGSWRDIFSRNLGMRGVGGTYDPVTKKFMRQAESTLPAVRAGEMGITNTSDAMRGAQMRGLIEQGYTPEMAAHITNKYQFDYANRTQFEKNVMSRLVPFYTFASRNLPLQLETLATKPGIPLTQMKPFMQDRDKPAYLPDYMAGHLSAAMGPGEQQGHQKFLQSMGLPIEEALSPMKFKGGALAPAETAMGYMAQLNPMIKYPLETIFDRQLFSGRKLSDLQAPQSARLLGKVLGEDNPQMLSELLANTPLTRFSTTADRLLDPRKNLLDKGVNLLTGAHITDVDVERQKAIEQRDALSEIMRGLPHARSYTDYYVPQSERSKMSQDEVERFREYATLQKQARDFAEHRRQQQRIGLPMQR